MATNNGIFYSQTRGLALSTNVLNRVVISTAGTTTFTGNTSGSTLIDARGASGNLMSVTDTTSGVLLAVNNSIGNTIFQVNSNNSIIGGTPGSNTLVISGTNVGINGVTSPTNALHVTATTNPVRFDGLTSSTNNRVLVSDTNGVISYRTDIATVTGATYANNTFLFTNNSGGTFSVTFNTVTGLTANTISATTYQNLPRDIFVTGGTYNNGTGVATFRNNTGGTFTVSGFSTGGGTDVFVTGGTYNSGTGIATFTNNTGGTFTVSGFNTGGGTDVYVSGVTVDCTNKATFTNTTGGTFNMALVYGLPTEYSAIISQSGGAPPNVDYLIVDQFATCFGTDLVWEYNGAGDYQLRDRNNSGKLIQGKTHIQVSLGINGDAIDVTTGYEFYFWHQNNDTIRFFSYSDADGTIKDDRLLYASVKIRAYP